MHAQVPAQSLLPQLAASSLEAPGGSTHEPLQQYVLPSLQPSSLAAVTAAHEPVPAPQSWQVGHDAALQQTKSTQLPDAHSVPTLQLSPRSFSQLPEPSHTQSVPVQPVEPEQSGVSTAPPGRFPSPTSPQSPSLLAS